jgi:hypothetical protein
MWVHARIYLAAVVLLCEGNLLPAVITGPSVGGTIPKFTLRDQSGKIQTLDSIAGPKGAMLVFIRSADW